MCFLTKYLKSGVYCALTAYQTNLYFILFNSYQWLVGIIQDRTGIEKENNQKHY